MAKRQPESVLAGGKVTAAYSCDRMAAALGGGALAVVAAERYRSSTMIDFKLCTSFFVVFSLLFGLFI